jgi:MoxR-like ATPase
MSQWHIFTGETVSQIAGKAARKKPKPLPSAPPWRRPGNAREDVLAATFRTPPGLVDAVNAALYLRRPLLISGRPGGGKSSLIHAVAVELGLGRVLTWAINSRSTLREALYTYDALARLQHLQMKTSSTRSKAPGIDEMGLFLTLGPLGTALASTTPRALLVDEIDKSDVDLPNDLLNVLDTGRFVVPELKRHRKASTRIPNADGDPVTIVNGEVTFHGYPFVVMTSNGERDFPAPFLRRCIQFQMPEPTAADLKRIVLAHFPGKIEESDPDLQPENENKESLLANFLRRRDDVSLSTDQVLNAFHILRTPDLELTPEEKDKILDTLFRKLG